MKILKNAIIKTYSGSSANPVIHEYKYNIVITNNFQQEIQDQLKKVRVDPNSLPNPTKIYFDKLSSFPRVKLTNNTQFIRTIKFDKSDVVCFSTTKLNIHRLYFRATYKFLGSDGIIYAFDSNIYTTCSYDFINKLGLPKDLVLTEIKQAFSISVAGAEAVDNLFNKYKKVITNVDLDNLISKDSELVIDETSLKSISSMLASSDPDVINMAFKALSNLDARKYACQIGEMLVNANLRNKRVNWNIITTQQFLQTLNMFRNELQPNSNKLYLRKLYLISTCEEDKEYGRQLMRKEVENNIFYHIEQLKHIYADIPLEYNFECK